MEQKTLLRLLILFLGFSYVLSLNEVPLLASAKPVKEDSTVQELVKQVLIKQRYHRKVLVGGEGIIEGRMDIESNDYPGTGANNHHDPKTPGRS